MKFYSRTQIRRLDNGMEIYVLPRTGGTVMAECYIRTGSIHEGRFLGCGLSHFLEHMLFQGCKGYPGTAVADTLGKAGCSVNAYTSFDRTVYHAKGGAEKLPLILEILSSMVRYPELPQERFNAEREVILREYDRTQDDPSRQLQETFFKTLFLRHPMRIPIIGRKEMISQVTRDMAMNYHAERYTPGRCFWVITGAADPDTVFELLESRLGSWQANYLEEIPPFPDEPQQIAPRTAEFVFPDTVARLTLGLKLPPKALVDMPATDILFGLLGMGSASRMNRKFELENPLALGVRSFCYTLPGSGVAGITAVAAPDKLGRLEKAIRKELEKVANGDISTAEIRREKTQQSAEYLRQLEDLEHISAIIGSGVLDCGNPDFGDVYQAKLDRTTPEQIREIAKICLKEEQFCITRQLPSKQTPGKKQSVKKPRTELEKLPVSHQIPVLYLPEHSIPLIHFSMIFPGGIIFENPEKSGTTKLLQALLGAGSSQHSESEILTLFDSFGAEFSVNAGANSFLVDLNAPRKSFAKAFALLKEILTSPRFEQREFEREKSRMIELLASRKTAALETAFDRTKKLLLGNHPVAAGSYGTTESLERLEVSDIASYYTQITNIHRTAAGFSGDISREEVVQYAEELLKSMSFSEEELIFPQEPSFPEASITEDIRLAREQTAVIVALKGERLSNPRTHLIFQLLNASENGLSAKLFKRIREDNALAYAVGMDMAGGFHPGWFAFYAQTRCDRMEDTTSLLKSEISRLGTVGLDQEEFESARERILFKTLKCQDSSSGRLYNALLDIFYHPDTIPDQGKEIEILKNLTLEEVNSLLRATFADAVTVSVRAGKIPEYS